MAPTVWKNILALRGLAMILVVVNHSTIIFEVLNRSLDGSLESLTHANYTIHFFLRSITPLCIPIFLFSSGFVLQKFVHTWKASFMGMRVILGRYIAWSLFFYAALAIFNQDFSIKPVLLGLIKGGPFSGYWFFVIVIQLYLVTPFFNNLLKRNVACFIILILLLQGAAFTFHYFNLFNFEPFHPLWSSITRFLRVLPIFLLGMLSSRRAKIIFPVVHSLKQKLGRFWLFLLVLPFIESLFTWDKTGEADFDIHRASLFISSLVFLGYFSSSFSRSMKIRRWLETIGNYSFGILLLMNVFLKSTLVVFWHIMGCFTDAVWANPPATNLPPPWLAPASPILLIILVVIGIGGPLITIRATENWAGKITRTRLFG